MTMKRKILIGYVLKSTDVSTPTNTREYPRIPAHNLTHYYMKICAGVKKIMIIAGT